MSNLCIFVLPYLFWLQYERLSSKEYLELNFLLNILIFRFMTRLHVQWYGFPSITSLPWGTFKFWYFYSSIFTSYFVLAIENWILPLGAAFNYFSNFIMYLTYILYHPYLSINLEKKIPNSQPTLHQWRNMFLWHFVLTVSFLNTRGLIY